MPPAKPSSDRSTARANRRRGRQRVSANARVSDVAAIATWPITTDQAPAPARASTTWTTTYTTIAVRMLPYSATKRRSRCSIASGIEAHTSPTSASTITTTYAAASGRPKSSASQGAAPTMTRPTLPATARLDQKSVDRKVSSSVCLRITAGAKPRVVPITAKPSRVLTAATMPKSAGVSSRASTIVASTLSTCLDTWAPMPSTAPRRAAGPDAWGAVSTVSLLIAWPRWCAAPTRSGRGPARRPARRWARRTRVRAGPGCWRP